MQKRQLIPLDDYILLSEDDMLNRSVHFYRDINRRRTVRDFANKSVDKKIIENCISAAGTAPSGANLQPWYFVAVSDPAVKKEIRIAAEKEEHAFYHGRASQEWLKDLEAFETNELKPFLEKAPWLIAVFEQRYAINDDGSKRKHYYVSESVGIATGILITAIHNAGLVSLTHTPSPMKFLNSILKRPANEKPFLLLVVGYPAENVKVPDIARKELKDIASFL